MVLVRQEVHFSFRYRFTYILEGMVKYLQESDTISEYVRHAKLNS